MVDYQACAATAALDEPSPCQPLAQDKPPVLMSLPHHRNQDSSGAYKHSSSSQQHISGQVGGGARVSLEEEEREGGAGLSSLDGGVGRTSGGALFGREALKRSRLAVEEDDQLSIPPMDLSGANDYAPAFFHPYQQQLYHHPHTAVEATNNLATLHSQQEQHQMTLAHNGHHPTASSAHMEASHFGGDAHIMTDRNNNHHHGGSLYPQLPGQAGFFHGLNVSEVLAELERERKKNAELQGRLSNLEARLGSSDNRLGPAATVENGAKKSKKQRRVEKTTGENEGSGKIQSQPDQLPPIKQEDGVVLHVTLPLEDPIQTERNDTGVTWMSREEVTQAELEKLSKDLVSDRDDSGDSDDDSDDDDEDEDELEDDEDGDGGTKKKKKSEGEQQVWKAVDKGSDSQTAGPPDLKEDSGKRPSVSSGGGGQVGDGVVEKKSRKKSRKERRKGKHGDKSFFGRTGFGSEMVSFRGPGVLASYKKAPKTAFCPKEVKRIMESGVLALKNAQSHTMRKIIVFASLGIRHGCEDLYELDFSHFSVVRRGEPYKSPKDPGEHVLYDQLGGRTKMFYPNKQNPILCPVRILDEERTMRPAGPSCPTCLFLCIKYGGRTRNLPQNEYVRQRMGRNKLKSFGPLMCQMALLVHIRTGSFFFKALGITLLFMAGFPDDLVRKETKYRNLDLLQKYYRSDEDTKGEQLFHPYPTFFPAAMIVPPPHTHKTAAAAKGSGKKGPPPLLSKPSFTPVVHRYLPPLPTRSPPAMPFRGMPPPFPPSLPPISQVIPTSAGIPAAGHPSPTGPPPPPPPSYGMYPPYPPIHQSGYVPMPWAPVSSYPPGPYPPPPYAFQPFPPHSSQFLPPFYGPPPYPFPPPYGPQSSMKEEKKEAEESGDSDGDSDSGSSGAAKRPSEKGNNKEVP